MIAQECLTPALPRFNTLYPEIQLDMRIFTSVTDEQTRGVDVMLMLGWPQVGDLVHRHIGATSFVVCAAPAYWAAHGKPQHPRELEQHNCLCIRGNSGTLMDLWHFKRGDERVSVAARGWLLTDNAHRDTVVAVAARGRRRRAHRRLEPTPRARHRERRTGARAHRLGTRPKCRRSTCCTARACAACRACACSSTS